MAGKAGTAAYTRLGLLTIREKLAEPYRTVALLHAIVGTTFDRKTLIELPFTALQVDGDDAFLYDEDEGTTCKLSVKARAELTRYLREYLQHQASADWLFPLPADSTKPANLKVCERLIATVLGGGEPNASGRKPKAEGFDPLDTEAEPPAPPLHSLDEVAAVLKPAPKLTPAPAPALDAAAVLAAEQRQRARNALD